MTSMASRSARTPSTSSAATPRSTPAPCCAFANATSRTSSTTAASPPPGRSPMPTRAVLRRGRAALPRPRPGRRGPHRAAALGSIPLPRRLHQPRIQQLHDDLVKAGHRPFHLPSGSTTTNPTPKPVAASAATASTASPADRRQDRRPRALRATRGEHPNVTLRTHAGDAPGTRRLRTLCQAARGRAARQRGEHTARTSSSSPAAQ